MPSRRGFLAAGLALPAVGSWAEAWAADAEPPTIEELVRKPQTLGAALSPSGDQIAVLCETTLNGKRFAYAQLIAAGQPDAKPAIVRIGDLDVEKIAWGSDQRLLVWIRIDRTDPYVPIGSNIATTISYSVRRLVAVDRDGENQTLMFGQDKAVSHNNFELSYVIDMLPDDPQHILMAIWDLRYDVLALHKVDISTGASEVVERGTVNTVGWFTQNGAPVIRMDSNGRNTTSLYARAPGASDWKLFRKIRKNDLDKFDFDFISLTEDPNIGIVATRGDGDKTKVLRKFDLRTLTVGEVVAGREDRDVDGWLVDARRRLLATQYTTDRVDYDFVSPVLAPHFRGMNKFFVGECNLEIVDWNTTQTRLLVRASGPTAAGGYYFYDREARRFDNLADEQPWLTGRLAKMEMLDVKTRDGRTLRAYLTRPQKAAASTPLVVLPHGGPEDRDSYEFDLWVQALAARGWAVLQPNFRGSGGYGRAFAEAGYRHWADRAQEDIDDAVAQVLGMGGFDAGRVAICGGSYGGYAALMGAVRRPDFYKAAVSVAGVSDLPEMMAFEKRSEGDDSPVYQYWVKQIGDPKADDAAMAAASPARNAAAIKAPVLLLHGDKDTIVDPGQSKIMAAALKAAGKTYQYQALPGADHRGWDRKTWTTVLTRMCDFLGQHLA
jgi:acetyl esterase/lipase